tara:strand:- start:805 stop:954 length:150 start_codon:yes stop_codon:yes gene_type:complete
MVIKANTIPIINNAFLILFILNYLMTGYIFNGILSESALGAAIYEVIPS